MGITKFSSQLIERHLNAVKTVLELGAQCMYIEPSDKPPFADSWYRSKGVEHYVCIDLAGDNGAHRLDLAFPLELPLMPFRRFDMVTDLGTSEHCVQMDGYESVAFHDGHINSIYPKGVKDILRGYYHCWKNKYDYCKIDGVIVSENPLTGHWPDHGYNYICIDFYHELSEMTGAEILELGEHPSMGNYLTGVNVFCVLKKTKKAFPTLEEFSTLPIFKK